jgi:transcriptional regulator with XRE-family HTH domain
MKKISALGSRIADILKARNITDIKKFEEDAGVPRDYIRLLIRGNKAGIDFEYGCKVARFLGLPPEELIEDNDVKLFQIAPNTKAPRWYKMDGHFMEPNIINGSFLLVDYGDYDISVPGIFLLELADTPTIRRGAIRGENFIISVDNKEFQLTEEYPKNNLPKILGHIVGVYKPL